MIILQEELKIREKPLVIGLISFIIGILLGTINNQAMTAAVFTAAVFLLFVDKRKQKKRYSLRQKIKLLLIYSLFFVGVLQSKIALSEDAEIWEKKIVAEEKVSFIGRVEQITLKKESYTFLVDEIILEKPIKGKVKKQLQLKIKESKVEQLPKIGQRIVVTGTYYPYEAATNFGQFDVKAYYESMNVCGFVKISDYENKGENYFWLRHHIWLLRERSLYILTCCVSDKYCGVVKSMLLGDRNELDEELNNLYQNVGIAHILSVSGLHISLLGMGLYQILLKLSKSRLIASPIAIFMMSGYCVMVGERPGSIRAVCGFCFCLLAPIIGRNYDMASATGLAGILILYKKPLLIFQSGFQYSFLAVFAISLIRIPLLRVMKSANKRLETMISSLALQYTMLPALLWHQFSWPMYGVILNLIVIPLLTFAVFFGVVGMFIGEISIFLGKYCFFPVELILFFYEQLGKVFLSLPASIQLTGRPSSIQLSVYVLLFAISFILLKRRSKKLRYYSFVAEKSKLKVSFLQKWKQEKEKIKRQSVWVGALFLGIIISTIFLHHIRPQGLQLTFLDVGQGDGIVLELPDGQVMAIDGGSSSKNDLGKYVLTPFLKASGIEKVDKWFITHPDADHYSGFLEIIGNYPIEEVYLSKVISADELVGEICKKHEVKFVETGMKAVSGGLQLEVLHPDAKFSTSDVNETSIILALSYKQFSALFMGDLGKDSEDIVAKRLKGRKVTLLKVGHHGSKNSTTEEFLQAIQPKISILSVGEKNRYGHPHAETIEKLERISSKILRTDKQGMIQIEVKEQIYCKYWRKEH